MAVVISSALVLSEATLPFGLNHARIGYVNHFRDGTVTASTAETGFPASAVANALTYQHWRPTALPAWVSVDAGEAKDVDYMAVAAHTIGTDGVSVKPQYSTDNMSWTDAASAVQPADNAPLMFLFTETSARYWRLHLSGTTVPSVGVVYVGKALAMQRRIYGGHTPITLSRRTEIRPNKSEGGQWLGRSIIRQGSATQFAWEHLTDSWYRANFDPFVESARKYPFFIAWRPQDFPGDIGYVWTNRDISPDQEGGTGFKSVSMDVMGLGSE